MNKFNSIFRLALVLLTLGVCFGCSTKSDFVDSSYEIPFANKGPVLVSDTNEYIGANQFLSAESSDDSNLRGFLSTQGMPQAIELVSHGEYPDELLLYYIQKQELYRLVELSRGWAIFAPVPFNPQVFAKLARDDSIRAKYSVLEQYVPKPTIDGADAGNKKSAKGSSKVRSTNTLTSGADDDVAHIVKGNNESIGDISLKYTGSKEMASAIGRINGFAVDEKLTDGTSIRIPRYMLKSLPLSSQSSVQVPVKAPRQLPMSTSFVPPTTIVESDDNIVGSEGNGEGEINDGQQ